MREVFKFAAVGAVNTLIDFTLLSLFVWFGVNIFLALSLSYTIGAINGYLLNNRWTYGHLNRKNTLGGLLRYVSISFVGLGLTEIVVAVLYKEFHIRVSLDKLAAVVVVFAWNYLANRHFTFRPTAKAPGTAEA
jgi:putative flippase GtrA